MTNQKYIHVTAEINILPSSQGSLPHFHSPHQSRCHHPSTIFNDGKLSQTGKKKTRHYFHKDKKVFT